MEDLNTFIVEVENPSIRHDLKQVCVRVGEGRSLANYIIVETHEPIEVILNIPGVINAEYDSVDSESGDFELLDNDVWVDKWPKIHTRDNIINWPQATISGDHGGDTYRFPRDGTGVDIYILDSGIMEDHEDLDGNVTTLYSVDGKPYNVERRGYRHGTMCASIAAGKVYGVAPGANIWNLAYDWKSSNAVKALDTALTHHLTKPTRNNSILSMSISTTSDMMHGIIRELSRNGVICVAAAGNDNKDIIAKPAVWAECISVGCVTKNLIPAYYTNYHKSIDVMAPGHQGKAATIGWPGVSINNKSLVGETSGTSAATPLVAGIIAIMLQGSDRIEDSSQLMRVKEWLYTYSLKVLELTGGQGKYKDTPNRLVSLTKMPVEPFYKKEPEPKPIKDTNPPKDIKTPLIKKPSGTWRKFVVGAVVAIGVYFLLFHKGG